MKLLSIIDSISEWVAKSTGFLVVVVTLLIVSEVTLRYAFNSPTKWGLELSIYLSMYIYLMAGAYAHSLRAHIRVDIIYNRLTPRGRAIWDSVIFLMAGSFFGALLWGGIEWWWNGLVSGHHSWSIWGPPMWPIQLVIPLATFFIVLQLIVMFVRDLNIAIRGKE